MTKIQSTKNLPQYQPELETKPLMKIILSKHIEDTYTNQKDRNYNNVEREIIYKIGLKGTTLLECLIGPNFEQMAEELLIRDAGEGR